jgi:hypothetical protein
LPLRKRPKTTKMSSHFEISCGTPGFAPMARTVVFGSVATAPRFVPGSAWTKVPAGASISSSPRTNLARPLATKYSSS